MDRAEYLKLVLNSKVTDLASELYLSVLVAAVIARERRHNDLLEERDLSE